MGRLVGAGLVGVAKVLSAELNIPLHAVTKCGPGTEIAVGPIHTWRTEDSKRPQESGGTQPPLGVTAVREHYRVVVVGAVRLSLCVSVSLSLCRCR